MSTSWQHNIECSPVWGSAAECQFQLLERHVCSVARLCPDQSFLSLCRQLCMAGASMLYKVKLNSNPCLFSELPSLLLECDIPELWQKLIHWCLKYQGLERPNLHGVSCWPRFECGMTFPTLCLAPERSMGSPLQSTVGCFSELCFLQFFVAQVLVGLRKQFIKKKKNQYGPVLLFLIITIIIKTSITTLEMLETRFAPPTQPLEVTPASVVRC